jgi:hypothetical protein
MRPDLVFSYWIYVWYIFYIFKYIKYSPKFALIVALIDNIIMWISMFIIGTSLKSIFYFIFINVVIKVIPLYTLRNEKIKMNDVFFTFFLSIVFVIWIHMNSQTLVGNLKLAHDSLLYDKNETPFLSLMSQIERNFKKM